ncbi:hypothetical protein GIB67_030444 [Kingdonia uniflora]|uniref:Retrotransposon Copia-like N-terminal domain-containing protein n=1 Tax=Kingdonia uniflora TaxID=39325 RepID=A0A7J7NE59_9MAGN|nr:hypothetical protein GIB67_030444 [Kingdonia uniflora]
MAIGDESSLSLIVSSIGTSEDVQSFNSVHDNPNLKITSQLLDGLNYVRWAQSVKLFVGGLGKIGFLLGIENELAELDPKYAKWFLDDSMVYSQRENNARIFQLSNEVGNFKHGTQTLGIYYGRLRSSWEELSHYDSFIEWPTSAPSKKVPILPMAVEIYAKIVEKTQVFQFLAGLNPDFEYARVHLLDRIPFSTLEDAHAYYLSDQSRRSPLPHIFRIPSETSVMAIRYAYLVPPSVPSQTLHTSSPSLSQLPAASGNSRPSRKKCDYCGKWGHLKTTCHTLQGHPASYQPYLSQSLAYLSTDSSVPDLSAFSAFSQDEINRFRQLLSMSSTPAAFHAGNFASANSIFASLTLPWIADSSVIDNMTAQVFGKVKKGCVNFMGLNVTKMFIQSTELLRSQIMEGKESYIDLKNRFSQYKAENDAKLDSLRDIVTSLKSFECVAIPTVNVIDHGCLQFLDLLFLTFVDAYNGFKMLPILGSGTTSMLML